MTDDLPELLTAQRDTLAHYARFEASLRDVCCALNGILELNFEPKERWLNAYFKVPEPGIPITREHIADALQKKRKRLISEQDLVYWATMLLLNPAYEFAKPDEDVIADWLNDISFNLDPTLDE